MKKTLLALFLSVALVFTMIPCIAFAGGGGNATNPLDGTKEIPIGNTTLCSGEENTEDFAYSVGLKVDGNEADATKDEDGSIILNNYKLGKEIYVGFTSPGGSKQYSYIKVGLYKGEEELGEIAVRGANNHAESEPNRTDDKGYLTFDETNLPNDTYVKFEINNLKAGDYSFKIKANSRIGGNNNNYYSINDDIVINFSITVDIAKGKATVAKELTYTGKALKPAVKVTDADGQVLVKDTDYTVQYTNNTKCGKATVKVTGISNYEGTLTATFNIKPAKAAISKVAAGKKYLKVTAKSQKTAGVTGYQFAYKKSGTKSYKTTTTTSTTKKITKLKSGKVYYVKVRTYKTIDGKKVYGEYSAAKKYKVK